MAVVFDPETLDQLRTMTPRQAFSVARDSVYRSGPAGSEDFLEAYEQLVEEGILDWDQVEEFER